MAESLFMRANERPRNTRKNQKMKNVILAYKENQVIAICESEEMAHSLAECVSCLRVSPTLCDGRKGNAIYGLHGLRLVSVYELLETENGRKAYQDFKNRIGTGL